MSEQPTQIKRLGIMAGGGDLPVKVAENALNIGHKDIVIYATDKSNIPAFKKRVSPKQIRFIRPGLMNRNFQIMHEDGIEQAVFAGKVNKWSIIRFPIMDNRALNVMKQQQHLNDDAVMLAIIKEFNKEGIEILSQTDYLQDFLIQPGVYSKRPPTEAEEKDIEMGFRIAKEMGRLDIGQTVVIHNLMVIAIEAIEGTDQAILRTKKWTGKKGGIVAKVEKPAQDLRFDIPTVGPKTLKAMRKSGLTALAVEAEKTFVIQRETMIRLANQWNMALVAR